MFGLMLVCVHGGRQMTGVKSIQTGTRAKADFRRADLLLLVLLLLLLLLLVVVVIAVAVCSF